jgi:hypothetical protein
LISIAAVLSAVGLSVVAHSQTTGDIPLVSGEENSAEGVSGSGEFDTEAVAGFGLRDGMRRERELRNDPEYRQRRLAQVRESLVSGNPGMMEEVGLSQMEGDRFLDLLAEYQVRSSGDLLVSGVNGSEQAVRLELMRRQLQVSFQRNEAIVAMLGPERFARWQQYPLDSRALQRANDLGKLLSQAGRSLDKVQLRSLKDILVAEARFERHQMALANDIHPQDSAGAAQIHDMLVKSRGASRERILSEATSFLSAPQIAVLRAQFDLENKLSSFVAGPGGEAR